MPYCRCLAAVPCNRIVSLGCRLMIFATLSMATANAWADTVEFTNGATLEGKITARDAESITVEATVAGQQLARQYPLRLVAAITIDGRREVLASDAAAGSSQDASPATAGTKRTKEEIEALIDQRGRTQPDWWESVKLDYPKTLDLSWPMPAPRPWNNQKNVGQYVWDIINPNPERWQGGVRFMHHLLMVNKDRPETRHRVMAELGRMYHGLLQDYPRAAFWWRQAGADNPEQPSTHGVYLAECYWKLGNKQMAVELLDKLPPQFPMIKLWADMGELDRALQLANANAQGGLADVALIYAGDACRTAGRHDQAIEYYQKILQLPSAGGRGAKRIQRNQRRAQANIEAIRLFDTLDVARVPDGTYQASSLGFKGPVQVAVTVKGHRIESVRVTSHHEPQSYTSLSDIPQRIVAHQDVKGIDATSGATVTSEAIINATAKALSQAMK